MEEARRSRRKQASLTKYDGLAGKGGRREVYSSLSGSGRSAAPAPGVILDRPKRAADTLARTARMWTMFRRPPMPMYVSLLPLGLLAGLLLL